ncbi:MAG: 3'-5' exoribonuclease [Muribaculaceae bacterium]|nr:3'-5' exoribonuclease [Muribaculaceae bacterium]MBQ6649020.1 3'-5' exoribonuclease [Muribaculaceae bacterium]
MDKVLNFVAIDFETMTAELTSACAIGLVKVIDGNIQQKFYSLINPIPDNRDQNNTHIHGITPEMVVSAPTFAQLFPQLVQFIGKLPIVCHNRGADINIMQRCMDYYGLTGVDTANNYCTYEMTGLSLTACCAQFGISMGAHHDALDDADACAKVFLACQGAIMATTFKGGLSEVIAASRTKKFEHATLIPIADDQVQNQDTPFFHAKVVITGTFAAYPKRNELGKLLQALGADVDTAITKRTNVVVMGQGAGPAKVKKIEALRAEGYDIRIIYEEELKQILDYGED